MIPSGMGCRLHNNQKYPHPNKFGPNDWVSDSFRKSPSQTEWEILTREISSNPPKFNRIFHSDHMGGLLVFNQNNDYFGSSYYSSSASASSVYASQQLAFAADQDCSVRIFHIPCCSPEILYPDENSVSFQRKPALPSSNSKKMIQNYMVFPLVHKSMVIDLKWGASHFPNHLFSLGLDGICVKWDVSKNIQSAMMNTRFLDSESLLTKSSALFLNLPTSQPDDDNLVLIGNGSFGASLWDTRTPSVSRIFIPELQKIKGQTLLDGFWNPETNLWCCLSSENKMFGFDTRKTTNSSSKNQYGLFFEINCSLSDNPATESGISRHVVLSKKGDLVIQNPNQHNSKFNATPLMWKSFFLTFGPIFSKYANSHGILQISDIVSSTNQQDYNENFKIVNFLPPPSQNHMPDMYEFFSGEKLTNQNQNQLISKKFLKNLQKISFGEEIRPSFSRNGEFLLGSLLGGKLLTLWNIENLHKNQISNDCENCLPFLGISPTEPNVLKNSAFFSGTLGGTVDTEVQILAFSEISGADYSEKTTILAIRNPKTNENANEEDCSQLLPPLSEEISDETIFGNAKSPFNKIENINFDADNTTLTNPGNGEILFIQTSPSKIEKWKESTVVHSEHRFGLCTHDLGYLKQPVFICLTCIEKKSEKLQEIEKSTDNGNQKTENNEIIGGFCEHCAKFCHKLKGHKIVNIGKKSHFRCDCGSKINQEINGNCSLKPYSSGDLVEGPSKNEENRYNHNFVNKWCKCDSADNGDQRMIQCIACEDWFHEKCVFPSDSANENETQNSEFEKCFTKMNYFCGNCSRQHFNEFSDEKTYFITKIGMIQAQNKDKMGKKLVVMASHGFFSSISFDIEKELHKNNQKTNMATKKQKLVTPEVDPEFFVNKERILGQHMAQEIVFNDELMDFENENEEEEEEEETELQSALAVEIDSSNRNRIVPVTIIPTPTPTAHTTENVVRIVPISVTNQAPSSSTTPTTAMSNVVKIVPIPISEQDSHRQNSSTSSSSSSNVLHNSQPDDDEEDLESMDDDDSENEDEDDDDDDKD